MSLRLYMDVQVPAEITARLRNAGVDVLTAQEDGCDKLEDADLLDRATELKRAILSFDQDFAREATRRQRQGGAFAPVFFAKLKPAKNRVYAEWLETYAKLEEYAQVASKTTFL